MQERADRRIRSGRWVLMVVVLVLGAAGAGLFFWFRMVPPGPSRPVAEMREPVRTPALRADEPLMVMIYLPSQGALAARSVGIRRQPDTPLQAREAVAALFSGNQAGLPVRQAEMTAVLADVRLKAFYLDTSGTAYVDLSPAGQEKSVKASARDELLAIYAVVNTLTQNFEEVKEVRFLVDGKEAETLAGHIDLSGSFSRRMDLVRQ